MRRRGGSLPITLNASDQRAPCTSPNHNASPARRPTDEAFGQGVGQDRSARQTSTTAVIDASGHGLRFAIQRSAPSVGSTSPFMKSTCLLDRSQRCENAGPPSAAYRENSELTSLAVARGCIRAAW